MRRIVIGIALCVLAAATVSADFSYTQTTRVTGGTLLNMTRFMPGAGQIKEPQTQTIAVKGGKMVTYNNDVATIIDADAETMTQVDFKKKQYAVITFAEMKQAMQALRAQLAQAQAQLAQAQGQQQAPQANPLEAMKVSVNETGQSKVISGLNTRQFILTMEMGAPAGAPASAPANKTTMDTWMAPTLPGYEEVTAFGVKMAAKMSDMATPGMNPMGMFNADVAKSLNTMAKEMSKMSGIPVSQTMTMTGMGASGPNVNAGDAAKGAATDAAVAGALGRSRLGGLAGLGGLGRRKQEDAKPAEQPQQGAVQPVVLMEQVTELTGLSATVDAAKFAVPAGFKQVEHEMKKLIKQ